MRQRINGTSEADRAPAFRSLVLDEIPEPDYLDMLAIALPATATTSPRIWAEEVFSVRSAPLWVRLAFGIRQLLAPLIGVPRAAQGIFAVHSERGDEALIIADDKHLDFRAAVGVDPAARLVRVTTAVRLHGWSGRLYFAPVALAHPVVVRSMMARAARRLARAGRATRAEHAEPRLESERG